MSNFEMFMMWLGIFLGFVCLVVAAGGYRMGWSKRAWVGTIVLAVVFLTVFPIIAALTMGLSQG
ncbi:hypothetical protein [Dietzia sp.]|uniref:hypothetical protein n=1 Tax=Dietzia sp. TaxID=1871616 RepID=UPI002FDA6626